MPIFGLVTQRIVADNVVELSPFRSQSPVRAVDDAFRATFSQLVAKLPRR